MVAELYFVNEVFPVFVKNDPETQLGIKVNEKKQHVWALKEGNREIEKIGVVLIRVYNDEKKRNNEDGENAIDAHVEYIGMDEYQKNEDKFIEGQFILRKDGQYVKGGNDQRAKREVIRNNFYRSKLIKLYVESEKRRRQLKAVKSYHINVGHGNCSVVVIREDQKYKIWMVDCSNFDFTNKMHYGKNIKSCFKYISKQFKLDVIKIEKLLLTHPHYDHISGVEELIKRGYVTNETEIWTNHYYSWPEKKYNRLLELMYDKRFNMVEPKIVNSTTEIEILYPRKTIVRVIPENQQNYPSFDIVPARKVNNASVIYKLNFGDRSMVFPGDIETEGWDKVDTCQSELKNATFYCISHHGSITGHKRNNCPYGRTGIKTIKLCTKDKNVNILMGRDGAYKGIFSDMVINDFSGRLFKTDQGGNHSAIAFLELDWDSQKITYHS